MVGSLHLPSLALHLLAYTFLEDNKHSFGISNPKNQLQIELILRSNRVLGDWNDINVNWKLFRIERSLTDCTGKCDLFQLRDILVDKFHHWDRSPHDHIVQSFLVPMRLYEKHRRILHQTNPTYCQRRLLQKAALLDLHRLELINQLSQERIFHLPSPVILGIVKFERRAVET